ncbi:MAG: hypothetical protein PVF87_12160 [Acidimicrobiia bacterium]
MSDNQHPTPQLSSPDEAQIRRSPMELRADCLAKMVNLEIHGDPRYRGLEIQVFDDDVHGSGTLVFLARADDGRTDVYHEPGLHLDRSGYEIGSGLGRWDETAFDEARVEFTQNGIAVDLGLTDHAGRAIRIRVDDRGGRTRRPAQLLAPMGAAIREPNRLPLVWMSRFDLVRRRGQLEVSIDGSPVDIGRLPGALLHRRRLVKYASDLFVVSLNPSHDGPIKNAVLCDASLETNGHRADLLFDREVQLGALNGIVGGRWRLRIDETELVGGSWSARRSDTRALLDLDVDEGWHPKDLPPFMRVVTTLIPVFTRWPTTYRWHAEIDLELNTMASKWARTDSNGDESYQKLTSAH